MHEDGWGDVESEDEEDNEEHLEANEGLLLPLEDELLCLQCISKSCRLPSTLLHGIEEVSLLKAIPLEVSGVLMMTHDVQEGDEARREGLVAPAFAMGFWECLMKTKADLEVIESLSNQDSDTERDLLSPGGAGIESPVGPLAHQELARVT
jgi:hypothetical protein